MAIYCMVNNFKGIANWFLVQEKEEYEHADKFLNYLIERGYKPKLQKINEPLSDFKSVLEVFEKALEHEKHVTERINNLYKNALKTEDYPTQLMLQWFVSEQVEEEANLVEIIEKLRLIGNNYGALFMLDSKLGERK